MQQGEEARAALLLKEAELPRAASMLVFDAQRLACAPRHRLREMLRLVWTREGWPQGRLGFEDWDRMARLWDAKTGLSITPPLRHDGTLRALAISRDGRTILTGSYDRTAQVWDKVTGKPIGPAFHHENQVWFVAISPDNRFVLSGGQENTAHLWKITTSVEAPISDVDRWLQASTGMNLLDDGSLHILDFAEWNLRREQACPWSQSGLDYRGLIDP